MLVLSLISCSKSEVVKEPERVYTKALDTTYTPRVVDTIEITNIPIGFDVVLDRWDEVENETK